MHERQPEGEVDPVATRLQRRAVERTCAAVGGGAAADPAEETLRSSARFEEQQLDASVRGRVERRRGPGDRPCAPAELVAPPLDRLGLTCGARGLEQGQRHRRDLAGRGMRLDLAPADDCSGNLGREQARELGPRLVAAEDHELRPAGRAEAAVDLAGDGAQMALG